MKRSLRSCLLVLLTVSQVHSITDFDASNCTDLIPILHKEYYDDGFLVAHLSTQNETLSTLIKYVKYTMDSINKDLKQQCPLFSGYMEAQIINCPDRVLHTGCSGVMYKGPGAYPLRSKRDGERIFAYCVEDPAGGDAWTVIQRRVENDVSFNRRWTEYEDGFGNIYGSYWLGLKEIYAMLDGTSHELWVLLQDFDDNQHSAKYSEFVLGNETNDYALIHLGNYSGGAGNSLRDSIGIKFSAHDKVNDGNALCPKRNQGAWWFADCGQSNLNGKYYFDMLPEEKEKGIYWNGWRGSQYSYKYVHMAIREKTSRRC